MSVGEIVRRELKCECGTCSVCKSRKRMSDLYHADPELARRKNREYRARKQHDAEWVAKQNESKRKWSIENRYDSRRDPKKIYARRLIQRLVLEGRVKKERCFCGAEAEAHHEDYEKPLEVEWLCRPHHAERHRCA